MQRQAQSRMDEIVQILKDIPRPMLMVIRSMNLLRSINSALGAPVDRFSLLAKSALRGIRENSEGTLTQKFQHVKEEVQFNVNLHLLTFKYWLEWVVLRALLFLGLAPVELGLAENFLVA